MYVKLLIDKLYIIIFNNNYLKKNQFSECDKTKIVHSYINRYISQQKT